MICLELFLTFFKIGLFTFGGGYAMIPFIQQEVLAKGWLGHEQLIDFIAVGESTPGPFAVNIATYIGTEKAGIPGALCATLGVVLPSFIVILLVARFFFSYRESRTVSGVMTGIRPAAIGLIGAAAVSIIGKVFVSGGSFTEAGAYTVCCSVCVFAVCFYIVMKKKSPLAAIAFAAAAGIIFGYGGEALSGVGEIPTLGFGA